MGDVSRESSARSSRRRRWEVNSKEAFETSLAFELASPCTDPPIEDRKTVKDVNNGEKSKDDSSPVKTKRPNTGRKISQKKDCPKVQSFKCEIPANLDVDSPPSDPLSEKLSALMEGVHINQDSPDAHHPPGNPFEDSPLKPKASAPPLESSMDKRRPKKRPRRKSVAPVDPSCSEITKQLTKLNEDIVRSQRPSQFVIPISGVLLDPLSSVGGNVNTNGGNISTIYCEKLNHFVLAKDSTLGVPLDGQLPEDSSKPITRASQALFIQTGFRTFSVLLQGLLAGITVAHCLFVLLFGADVIAKDAFMQTFFALIIFLSSICVVSSFDRCDLAGQGIFSGSGIRFPWTPLFYLISLTLSLIMIRAEDYFSNYQYLSKDYEEQGAELFTWWRNLCVARTCFAVLGWVVVVADPHVDVLRNRITQLT